jgi:hypothetical protein
VTRYLQEGNCFRSKFPRLRARIIDLARRANEEQGWGLDLQSVSIRVAEFHNYRKGAAVCVSLSLSFSLAVSLSILASLCFCSAPVSLPWLVISPSLSLSQHVSLPFFFFGRWVTARHESLRQRVACNCRRDASSCQVAYAAAEAAYAEAGEAYAVADMNHYGKVSLVTVDVMLHPAYATN